MAKPSLAFSEASSASYSDYSGDAKTPSYGQDRTLSGAFNRGAVSSASSTPKVSNTSNQQLEQTKTKEQGQGHMKDQGLGIKRVSIGSTSYGTGTGNANRARDEGLAINGIDTTFNSLHSGGLSLPDSPASSVNKSPFLSQSTRGSGLALQLPMSNSNNNNNSLFRGQSTKSSSSHRSHHSHHGHHGRHHHHRHHRNTAQEQGSELGIGLGLDSGGTGGSEKGYGQGGGENSNGNGDRDRDIEGADAGVKGLEVLFVRRMHMSDLTAVVNTSGYAFNAIDLDAEIEQLTLHEEALAWSDLVTILVSSEDIILYWLCVVSCGVVH
jgi:hypothetical protein